MNESGTARSEGKGQKEAKLTERVGEYLSPKCMKVPRSNLRQTQVLAGLSQCPTSSPKMDNIL